MMLENEFGLNGSIAAKARALLASADQAQLRIATAESCTGGLLATLLTGVSGVSHCFECGFIVYSDAAKERLLGICGAMLQREGAVSMEVACEMAKAALRLSEADVAVAITGFAGPGERAIEGLVHLAAVQKGETLMHRVHNFGSIGRDPIRVRAVSGALDLLQEAVRA
jgi:nicotinamide-nucleotide amidase